MFNFSGFNDSYNIFNTEAQLKNTSPRPVANFNYLGRVENWKTEQFLSPVLHQQGESVKH